MVPQLNRNRLVIQKGDLLSHGIPLHKNSPVYEVMDVEPDGTIFLSADRLNLIESITDLVTLEKYKARRTRKGEMVFRGGIVAVFTYGHPLP